MSNAAKRAASSMDGQGAQEMPGIVAAFNPGDHTGKVTVWQGLPDEFTTDWIPIGVGATFAGGGGVVSPPCIGEQVMIAPSDNSSDGWHVTKRVFSVLHTPPISPATGKPVQSGEAAVFVPATPGEPGIGAFWHLSGGNIFTAGAWSHKGKLVASDTITSEVDVISVTVSGKGHDHGGVKAGSDTSGPPVQ